jgi:hypothetical protein
MLRVMIDSSTVGVLALHAEVADLVRDRVKAGEVELVCAARVQRDEAERTPDPVKRDTLLAFLDEVTVRVVTPLAVFGVSRWGESVYTSDENAAKYRDIQVGNVRHSEDAVIIITAKHEGIPLVTDDKRMGRQCSKQGVAKMTCTEFIAMIR